MTKTSAPTDIVHEDKKTPTADAFASVEDYTAVNVRNADPEQAMKSGTVHTSISTHKGNSAKTVPSKVVLNEPKQQNLLTSHDPTNNEMNTNESVVHADSNLGDKPELR